MDSFDPTRWNHWLLIGCFVGLSGWGLYLWWQWGKAAKAKRKQTRLARRLAIALHGIDDSEAEIRLSPQQGSAYQKSSGRR
jgi:hypothetical protein